MGSILLGLKSCLGIDIVMPRGFAEERTYVKLGPGPTRAVLDDLLSGTGFNYVIESSAPNHGKILAIVLTDRATEPGQGRDGLVQPQPFAVTPVRRMGPIAASVGRPLNPGAEPEDGSVVMDEKSEPAKAPEGQVAPPPGDSNASVARPAAASPANSDAGSLAGFPAVRSGPSIPAMNDVQTAETPVDVLPKVQQPAANGDSQNVPSSATAAADLTPSQIRDSQITQMQQMFEQRKNMMANPAPATGTPPPPID